MRDVRVQQQPVEVGVQRRGLVLGRALDLDPAELLLPQPPGLRLHLVERRPGRDLEFEVALGLGEADQRRRDPQRDVGAVELEVARDAPPRRHADFRAPGGGGVGHAVDEHPARPGRQAAADPGVPADHAGVGVEPQPAAVADVVEQQPAVLVGEGEPHDRRVRRRREVGGHPVGEPDAVVVRGVGFVVVGEGQRALAAVAFDRPGAGHDVEGVAVAHPRARLVAQGERLQRRAVPLVVVAVVGVDPVGDAGVGDRGPEVEAVRHRGGGEVVAAGEVAAGVRAPRGADVVDRLPRRLGPLGDADVVDPPGDVGVRRAGAQHDPADPAPGERAQRPAHRVPLVHPERLVVDRLEPGARPVGEFDVEADPGGVVGGDLPVGGGEDHIGQLGARGDGEVEFEQDRARPRAVAQGPRPAEADAGLGRGRAVRSAVHDRGGIRGLRITGFEGGEEGGVGHGDTVSAERRSRGSGAVRWDARPRTP